MSASTIWTYTLPSLAALIIFGLFMSTSAAGLPVPVLPPIAPSPVRVIRRHTAAGGTWELADMPDMLPAIVVEPEPEVGIATLELFMCEEILAALDVAIERLTHVSNDLYVLTVS